MPRNLTATQAAKIAWLLNSQNNLTTHYSAGKVMSSSAEYYFCNFGEIIAGCVAVEKVSFTLSEIKHLSVHPDYKRRGIASFLIKKSLFFSKTPFIYATIRSQNIGSIKAFERFGFVQSAEVVRGTNKLGLYVKGR